MSRNNQPSQNTNTTQSAADDDERDTRVRRDPASDIRGDRGTSEDVNRNASAADLDAFEQLVRDEFEHTALPVPPKLQGYHLCWLTTTSQYDSISRRHRLGYQPVRKDELPGFDPSTGSKPLGNDFDGYVTCNELVLHKIPEAYYQRMMAHFHHKRPLEDEQVQLEKINEEGAVPRDQTGRAPGLLEGGLLEMQQAGRREINRTPMF